LPISELIVVLARPVRSTCLRHVLIRNLLKKQARKTLSIIANVQSKLSRGFFADSFDQSIHVSISMRLDQMQHSYQLNAVHRFARFATEPVALYISQLIMHHGISLAPLILERASCDGQTPLRIAAHKGRHDLFVLFLRESGAALDPSLLWLAIDAPSHSIVHLILDRTVDKCALIELRDKTGRSALQQAATTCERTRVESLLNRNNARMTHRMIADIRFQCRAGRAGALDLSSYSGSVEETSTEDAEHYWPCPIY